MTIACPKFRKSRLRNRLWSKTRDDSALYGLFKYRSNGLKTLFEDVCASRPFLEEKERFVISLKCYQ